MRAFLSLRVTSWQIPKPDGPGSGDVQLVRASSDQRRGPWWQSEGLGTRSRWAGVQRAGFRPTRLQHGLCPRPARGPQGRARAGLLWAKDQGSWLG